MHDRGLVENATTADPSALSPAFSNASNPARNGLWFQEAKQRSTIKTTVNASSPMERSCQKSG